MGLVRTAAMAAMVAGAAAAPAGAAVLGGDAAACSGGEGPAILATVSGLKDREGALKLELYPANEQDFLRDDRDLISAGKVFRRVEAPAPKAGPVSMCIRVPRPGQYALLFTHNRDGKQKFSFWSDGAGFVGNARIGRARPKLAQALVTVGPRGVTSVSIRAQYLHGLGGFSPMDG